MTRHRAREILRNAFGTGRGLSLGERFEIQQELWKPGEVECDVLQRIAGDTDPKWNWRNYARIPYVHEQREILRKHFASLDATDDPHKEDTAKREEQNG